MSEADRFAYLDAMEITQWVPRELTEAEMFAQNELQKSLQQALKEQRLEAPEPDLMEISDAQANAFSDRGALENHPDSDQDLRRKNDNLESNEQYAKNATVRSENINSTQSLTPVATLNASAVSKIIDTNLYLKMVAWVSQETASISVLIICRHQVDQPANSFAKANSPSQFMQDYIQALNQLMNVDANPNLLQVRLAHLSQAGLSANCQPLQQIIAKIKPKLILVLGEEALSALFSKDAQVASLRGQLHELALSQISQTPDSELQHNNAAQAEVSQCIVSYHPYTLIKNPHLKKLALEDLRLIAGYLLQS